MKKMALLLLCCLAAFWSCNLEDNFTQTNLIEMLNYKDGTLFNDYGYVLNVTEDGVGADKWKVEGGRFLALFDVLNRSLDIRLKQVVQATVQAAAPYDQLEELPQDPVSLQMQGFSGGYLNLEIEIEKAKHTECLHTITFRRHYENNQLTVYICHLGNQEDSAHMESSELETEFRVYSIPADDFKDITQLVIVYYKLVTDDNGNKYVKESKVMLN